MYVSAHTDTRRVLHNVSWNSHPESTIMDNSKLDTSLQTKPTTAYPLKTTDGCLRVVLLGCLGLVVLILNVHVCLTLLRLTAAKFLPVTIVSGDSGSYIHVKLM